MNHVKIAKLTVCHYQSIYIASIGFSPHSMEMCQFKILSIVLFKHANRQIFNSPITPLVR